MNLPAWDAIDLVVFDLDGTLYDAAPLRRAMAARLLADALASRSLRTIRVLRAFRQVREALGEEPGAKFLSLQDERTARRAGCTTEEVRALVADWMEQRPLPLLRAFRARGVERVFDALRAAGKRVAVLSDYPARDKLDALGLSADWVVWAGDPGIGRLKPDPRGLRTVLDLAGVSPARALMVGDRLDRDVAAAHHAGVPALLRARRPLTGVASFARYDDPPFAQLLAPSPQPVAA